MSLVQCVAADNGAGAATLVIGSGQGLAATSAGSAVLVFIQFNNAQSISSVKDNNSNSFATIIAATSYGSYSMAVYALFGAASLTSVTITLSASTPCAAFVAEESGIAASSAVDGSNTNPNGIVTTWASSALTTTNANDVLYGCAESPFSSSVYTGAGSGWAAVTGTGVTGGNHGNSGDGDSIFLERQVVTATGSYTATGTCVSNSNTLGAIVALKQASGGSNPIDEDAEWPMFVQAA